MVRLLWVRIIYHVVFSYFFVPSLLFREMDVDLLLRHLFMVGFMMGWIFVMV
jgi:uncharacterized membrane protein YciS (DUF1049 family)